MSALGCRGPRSPEALVDLRTDYGTVHGTSTESGILVLSELVEEKDELAFRYHIGSGMFDDVANVTSRGPWLSVLDPTSSRPNQVRFAARPAEGDDQLFVESRNVNGDPTLVLAHLHSQGALGDLLTLDDQQPLATAARRLAGCGVYVHRENHLQLVGLLNGIYLDGFDALGYVGLDQIARVLPHTSSYFERQSQPYRADFEYGIPRDFLGEKPHASGLGPIAETPAEGAAALPGDDGFEQMLKQLPAGDGGLEQMLKQIPAGDGD